MFIERHIASVSIKILCILVIAQRVFIIWTEGGGGGLMLRISCLYTLSEHPNVLRDLRIDP